MSLLPVGAAGALDAARFVVAVARRLFCWIGLAVVVGFSSGKLDGAAIGEDKGCVGGSVAAHER
jgi:hypothetical protein